MLKKGYKGRCEKRKLSKSREVVRTYNAIQFTYADILENDESILEIHSNVLLENLEEGEYTTDFVCIQVDGKMLVRECVQRKHLMKPMTVKLLDASKKYWLQKGVSDWGLVIDAKK